MQCFFRYNFIAYCIILYYLLMLSTDIIFSILLVFLINQIEIISHRQLDMLDHIIRLLTAPPPSSQNHNHAPLITLSRDLLIVNNHYHLLWNVLPKKMNKIITKHAFIKQMEKYGFQQLSNQQKKQIPGHVMGKNQDKIILLKMKNVELKEMLVSIQGIMLRKSAEQVTLKAKITNIKQLILTAKTAEKNGFNIYELLQQISSIKALNHKIYTLNEDLSNLIGRKNFFGQHHSKGNHINSSELMEEIKYLQEVTTIHIRTLYSHTHFNHPIPIS